MDTSFAERSQDLKVKLFFKEQVSLTGITEYGISWNELINGEAEIPLSSARFDISFEGVISGEKLNGVVKGVDYLKVRPDGKFMLNIQASIISEDGESISLEETGILVPTSHGSAKLYLNMNFSTASPKYKWVNKTLAWGVGTVNLLNGTVTVNSYHN